MFGGTLSEEMIFFWGIKIILLFVKEKKKRYWYRQMTWDLRTIDETPVVSFVFPGLYLIAIIIAPPVKQWMDTTSLGWCLGHVSTRGTPLTLLQADVGWFLTIHAGTAFPWSLPTSTWDLIGAVREDETMEGPIIDGTRYPFKNQETIDSEVLVSPRLSMSLQSGRSKRQKNLDYLGFWFLQTYSKSSTWTYAALKYGVPDLTFDIHHWNSWVKNSVMKLLPSARIWQNATNAAEWPHEYLRI